jgi:hypothetical protein
MVIDMSMVGFLDVSTVPLLSLFYIVFLVKVEAILSLVKVKYF